MSNERKVFRGRRACTLSKCLMLVLAIATLLSTNTAEAARRALVIGIDKYKSVSELRKAVNDADAIAKVLSEAGFQVTVKHNSDRRDLFDGLLGFVESIQGGDEVVFFFAGHGVQIDSASFLLPSDFRATSDRQVSVDALSLQYVMDQLQDAKSAFSLLIIDACRDNPLPRTAGRSIGASRGLTPTQPPVGQIVVYSAGKGQTALDRLTIDPKLDPDPNSIFTREFLKQIRRRGVPVKDLLEDLQQSVEELAGSVRHAQRPAIYSEARGRFYFFTGPINASISAAPVDTEREVWEGARSIDTIGAYEAYLSKFAEGRYAGLAHAQIAKLRQGAQPPVARRDTQDARPPLAMNASKKTKISVAASRFVRSLNVALGGPNNAYGADVLLNGPPYDDRANIAEYEFVSSASGKYLLAIEYAAATPRPVRVLLNGNLAIADASSAPTGCWEVTCQRLVPQGPVTLREGLNVLRIERNGVFPHLRGFVLEPMD